MFDQALRQHRDVFARLDALQPAVQAVAQLMATCLRQGGKLMFCGNGGSAADSQHLAAEFTGRFRNDRAPLAALALSTDSSALTCIGNDYGFDHVFERQVRALGLPADMLVAISTSGRSANVLLAARAAKNKGLTVVGLLGRDGGELASLCDLSVVVPAQDTARIQEAHIFIGHLWCEMVEAALAAPAASDDS